MLKKLREISQFGGEKLSLDGWGGRYLPANKISKFHIGGIYNYINN